MVPRTSADERRIFQVTKQKIGSLTALFAACKEQREELLIRAHFERTKVDIESEFDSLPRILSAQVQAGIVIEC